MAHRPTRARQSRRSARLDFGGLEIVGALLTPDIVARLAAFEANDQSEESYEIPAGLKLRDEIARYYRIGEALWSRFETTRGQTVAASERFVLDLLRQCFGFDSIKPQQIPRLGDREFPLRHAALGGRVPIVIAPARPKARGVPVWMKAFLSSGTALAGVPRPCSCKSTSMRREMAVGVWSATASRCVSCARISA
jgi:hypothetical protein